MKRLMLILCGISLFTMSFGVLAESLADSEVITTKWYSIRLPYDMQQIAVPSGKAVKKIRKRLKMPEPRTYLKLNADGQAMMLRIVAAPMKSLNQRYINLDFEQKVILAITVSQAKQEASNTRVSNKDLIKIESNIKRIKLNNKQFMSYQFDTDAERVRMFTMADKGHIFLIEAMTDLDLLHKGVTQKVMSELTKMVGTFTPHGYKQHLEACNKATDAQYRKSLTSHSYISYADQFNVSGKTFVGITHYGANGVYSGKVVNTNNHHEVLLTASGHWKIKNNKLYANYKEKVVHTGDKKMDEFSKHLVGSSDHKFVDKLICVGSKQYQGENSDGTRYTELQINEKA